jgi:hypothetical protein
VISVRATPPTLPLSSDSLGHTDITNTVRFKCANDDCRDLDICASCFTEGKEGQTHKPWHDYMVEVCTRLRLLRVMLTIRNP